MRSFTQIVAMTSRGLVKLEVHNLGGVTLGYGVSAESYPVGAEIEFIVWGLSYTPKAIALAVALPSDLPRAIGTIPHITLAWPSHSAPVQGKYALIFGHTIVLSQPILLKGIVKFIPFKK